MFQSLFWWNLSGNISTAGIVVCVSIVSILVLVEFEWEYSILREGELFQAGFNPCFGGI
jgi:hypothetical protein